MGDEENVYETVWTTGIQLRDRKTEISHAVNVRRSILDEFDPLKPIPPVRNSSLNHTIFENTQPIKKTSMTDSDSIFSEGEGDQQYRILQPEIEFDGESVDDLSIDGDEKPPPTVCPKKTCTPKKASKEQGYLFFYQEAKFFKWIRRWVVIKSNELLIFGNDSSKVTKAVIPIAAMVDVEPLEPSDGKFRFQVRTKKCSYIFGHPDLEICTNWSQYLMLPVLESKRQSNPDINTYHYGDLKAWIKIEGIRTKRFFSLRCDKLVYYKSEEDYLYDMPIHRIDLQIVRVQKQIKSLTSVKIVTPYRTYTLIFESASDCDTWTNAISAGVQSALSGDFTDVSDKIFSNKSNRNCCDCGKSDPTWASVNLAITLCNKCAGVHRELGATISKVRGISLDSRIWTTQILELMAQLGNNIANDFWESDIGDFHKPKADAESEERNEFIKKKYLSKSFTRSFDIEKEEINDMLIRMIKDNNIVGVMKFLFSGASQDYASALSEGLSAYQLAEKLHREEILQFLVLNKIEEQTEYKPCELGKVEVKAKLKAKVGQLSDSYRTVTIKKGILTLLESNDCPVDVINCRDMILVENDKILTVFLKDNPIKIISFSDFELTWPAQLARNVAPFVCFDCLEAFTYSGWGVLKYTAYGDFLDVWMRLNNRELIIFERDNQEKLVIDLRKAYKIWVSEEVDSYQQYREATHPVAIQMQDRTLYFQAETESATKRWIKGLETAYSVSSLSLKDQLLTKRNIPVAIEKAVDFLELYGCHSDGIYRVSGNQAKVSALYDQLLHSPHSVTLCKTTHNVNEVAGALKRFLSKLHDPPMTQALFPDWRTASRIVDFNKKFQSYKELFSKLEEQEENYNTVRCIILHLATLARFSQTTRMDIKNFATLFSQLLLRPSPSSRDEMQESNHIISDIIDQHVFLFNVTQEETRKAEVSFEAQNKMTKANSSNSQNSEVKITIHLQLMRSSSETNSEQFLSETIRDQTTADEVLTPIIAKHAAESTSNHSLFEVILENEVERVLQPEEMVFTAVMRWQYFPHNSAKLIVKYNYIAEQLEDLKKEKISSRVLKAKFADKTAKFSTHFVCIDSNIIRLYRNQDCSEPAACFCLNEIVIYCGLESKRKPPTGFEKGFTFYTMHDYTSKTVPPKTSSKEWFKLSETPKEWFGKALAFSTHEDYNLFLAASYFLRAQTSNVPMRKNVRKPSEKK